MSVFCKRTNQFARIHSIALGRVRTHPSGRPSPHFLFGIFACVLLSLLVPLTVTAQDDIPTAILTQLNLARLSKGLPVLSRNPQLDAAAQAHANDLLANGVRLGHRGSDGSTIGQRIAGAGYPSGVVGENWASYRTIDLSIAFWLRDPPHRQNILAGKFTEIGIGVAPAPGGDTILVTDFGGPGGPPARALIAKPAAVVKKAAPAQAPAKPTAKPKAKVVPTRKPAAKPQAQPTHAPTDEPAPTQVALAVAPLAPLAVELKPLHARGKFAYSTLSASAASELGKNILGDPIRMSSGALLALAGTLLLGVAMVGQRRRSRWL